MAIFSLFFLEFSDYRDSDATIKICQFFNELSSPSGKVLFEHLLEEFRRVVLEIYEFEKVDVYFDKILGLFGQSQIRSKKYMHSQLSAKLAAKSFQKQRNPTIIFKIKLQYCTDLSSN